MSKVADNSLPKNDGEEQSLSSSPEFFRVPEEASPSTEGARRRKHGNPSHTQKEWYSKTEAARYLGMAEITITRYLDKGILHAHRLPTPRTEPKQSSYNYGRLRVHKSELDRYLESTDRRPKEQIAQAPVGQGIRYGVYKNDKDAAPISDNGDGLMTRQEAAVRLGVSWRTIDRYIKSGVLKFAGYVRCPDSYTRAHVYRSEVENLPQGSHTVR